LEPLVSDVQFVATSRMMKRNAIVRITNECPRTRMTTAPRRTATPAATAPPSGTYHHCQPCCCAMTPAVYAPMPTNALWPSETYPAKPEMMFQPTAITAIRNASRITFCLYAS